MFFLLYVSFAYDGGHRWCLSQYIEVSFYRLSAAPGECSTLKFCFIHSVK